MASQTYASLSEEEAADINWLIVEGPSDDQPLPGHTGEGYHSAQWTQGMSMFGVKIWREEPTPPQRVYKLKGVLKIDQPPGVLYQICTSPEHMLQWDPLMVDGHYISRESQVFPTIERSTAFAFYRVPGGLIWDRELALKSVAVQLESGTLVVYARSAEEADLPEHLKQPGDKRVRAIMGASGWLLTPHEGGTLLTMILQVDPKGAVPASVAKFCGFAVPLHLHRIRNLVKRMTQHEIASLKAQFDVLLNNSDQKLIGQSNTIVNGRTSAMQAPHDNVSSENEVMCQRNLDLSPRSSEEFHDCISPRYEEMEGWSTLIKLQQPHKVH